MNSLFHFASHWYEYALSAGVGAAAWSWASFAAQSFPVPENKYGKWLLLVIQKALANQNKVDAIKAATGPDK